MLARPDAGRTARKVARRAQDLITSVGQNPPLHLSFELEGRRWNLRLAWRTNSYSNPYLHVVARPGRGHSLVTLDLVS
jgi:hypothetical protein